MKYIYTCIHTYIVSIFVSFSTLHWLLYLYVIDLIRLATSQMYPEFNFPWSIVSKFSLLPRPAIVLRPLLHIPPPSCNVPALCHRSLSWLSRRCPFQTILGIYAPVSPASLRPSIQNNARVSRRTMERRYQLLFRVTIASLEAPTIQTTMLSHQNDCSLFYWNKCYSNCACHCHFSNGLVER